MPALANLIASSASEVGVDVAGCTVPVPVELVGVAVGAGAVVATGTAPLDGEPVGVVELRAPPAGAGTGRCAVSRRTPAWCGATAGAWTRPGTVVGLCPLACTIAGRERVPASRPVEGLAALCARATGAFAATTVVAARCRAAPR
jgi:hypothetical protein